MKRERYLVLALLQEYQVVQEQWLMDRGALRTPRARSEMHVTFFRWLPGAADALG